MIWLLHGNLGSTHDWDPVIHHLERFGYSCRTLNLWKFLECCPKSLNDMGKVLCSEIGAQDKHPILCGYSLGGRLAMHALLHYPSLWQAAIFISANPGLKTSESRAERLKIDTEWAVKCLHEPWNQFLSAWDNQAVLASSTHTDRSALPSWKKAIARAFMDWSVGRQQDLQSDLEHCPTPQLWMTGERDTKFTQLAQSIQGKDHTIIPQVGHRIIMDAPAECAEHIHDWLQTITLS